MYCISDETFKELPPEIQVKVEEDTAKLEKPESETEEPMDMGTEVSEEKKNSIKDWETAMSKGKEQMGKDKKKGLAIVIGIGKEKPEEK